MKNLILLFLFTIWISVGFSLFWLLRPVTYLDNFNSYINCDNGNYYQAGSNFIYSKDLPRKDQSAKLDDFNDKKARKICEHSIIQDYQDAYSTPIKVNYRYRPAIRQDSNWLEVILITFGFVYLLTLFTDTKKYKSVLILAVILSFPIFIFLTKEKVNNFFCQRKAALQSEDFKKSANKAGRLLHELDERYKEKVKKEIYKNCLNE